MDSIVGQQNCYTKDRLLFEPFNYSNLLFFFPSKLPAQSLGVYYILDSLKLKKAMELFFIVLHFIHKYK